MTAVRPSAKGTSPRQHGRAEPTTDLTVHNLGSGSSGNALLIVTGDATLLVDCGVERRALLARLAATGHSPANVSGVLVSHEHRDHARSLPVMLGANVPVVASEGTLGALGLRGDLVERAREGRETVVGRFRVAGLPVAHDAKQPIGFTIAIRDRRITVLTDLGSIDGRLADAVSASDLIVIEANHDDAMLRHGPYPPHLKRRILSPRGHLSNADCAHFLRAALADARRIPTILLAHLSRTNNQASLARNTVAAALADAGIAASVVPLRHGGGQVWQPEAASPRQLRLPW